MKIILTLLGFGLLFHAGIAQNCNAPTVVNLSSTNNGNNSTTLICNIPNKHAYEWSLWYAVENTSTNLGTTNTGAITIYVKPGKYYNFQCRVECTANNFSAWSPPVSFWSSCDRIRNYEVHTSNITSNSVQVSTDITGADGYEWRYPEPDWNDPVAPAPYHKFNSDGPSTRINGLQSRTTYELSVRMLCGLSWSDWSTPINFQTLCKSAQTNDLEVDVNSSTSATLKCNIPNADEYQFRFRTQGATTWNNLPKSSRDYIGLLNLMPMTDYEAQCQIWCNGAGTGWSGSVPFSTPDECSNPSAVIPIVYDEHSAQLTCIATSSAKRNAIIELKKHFDNGWSVYPPNEVIEVNNLESATTYDCRCKTICNDGTISGYSPVSSFRTENEFACEVQRVRDFYNADGLNIYFDHYPDLNGFIELNYRIQGSVVWLSSIKQTTSGSGPYLVTTTFLITPVDAGVTYEYRYRVRCGADVFNTWSGITEISIPPCDPPYPHSFTEVTTPNDLVDVTIELYNGSTITDCDCVGVETSSNAYIGGRKVGPNMWQFTQLLPNNRYSYRCRAKCNPNNPGWSEWANTSTFSTDCNNRRGNVTDVTTSTITVVCLPASDFAYNAYVHYRPVGTNNWQTSPRQSGNVVTLTGLMSATKYEMQVQIDCHNSESYGPYSDSFFATTLAEPGNTSTCDPPDATNLYTDQITTNSATIHCNISGQVAYDFRARVKGMPAFTDIPESANSSRMLPGLMPGTEYEYQCRIKCTTNFSDWSESVFFTTEEESVMINECFAPQVKDLSYDQIGETEATIQCNLPADGYDFRVREAGTLNWTDHNDSDPGITLLGLTAGTTYQFECRVACDTEKSDWSDPVSFSTLSLTCDQPVLNQFRLIERTENSFEIETVLTGNAGYEYRYRESGSVDWIGIPVSVSGYILLEDLAPGTLYDIQARIFCSETNISPWSKSVQVTTLNNCGVPTVDQLAVENITDNSANLISLVENIPIYDFRYRLMGSSTWIELNPTREGEYPIDDLQPDKTYEFQNRVYCPGIGVSDWSASQTFHTAGQTTATHDIESPDWRIFPNPTSGYFTIALGSPVTNGRITVTNLQGQLVKQLILMDAADVRVEMKLPTGFYIVSLQVPGSIKSNKLIVQ